MIFEPIKFYEEKTKKLIPEYSLSTSDFYKNRPKSIKEKPKLEDLPKNKFTDEEVKKIYKEILKEYDLRSDLSFSK